MVPDPYLRAGTNVNSKWITDLNVRAETVDREETWGGPSWPGIGQVAKEKIDEWVFTKTEKPSCL